MFSPTYINGADTRLLRRLVRQHMRGRVLDVGCGQATLKRYLPPKATYVGMDARAHPSVDVVGDIQALPFDSASFDSVLCTSVLEHVRDEHAVITEMGRVLKPGGVALITIPFLLHYHADPEDYRRFTHIGLQDLLQRHGFSQTTAFMNYGVFTVVEFAFFSVLVHARREKLFTKKWYLLPYYFVIGVCMIFFRLLNYLTFPLQQHDTSLYAGVAVVAQKTR